MPQQVDRMTITIRTNEKLHKRLKAAAEKNRRSINREAERLLEAALDAEEAEAKAETRKK